MSNQANTERGRIILTFDDGSNGSDKYGTYTHAIIEALGYFGRVMQVPVYGTFFVNGQWVQQDAEWKKGNIEALQRAYREGHEIANHSFGHTLDRKWTAQRMKDDITKTNETIKAAGIRTPKFFRAPGGSGDWSTDEKAKLNQVLSELDMKNLDWDIGSNDHNWVGHPQKIISEVIRQALLQPTRDHVILFHDGPPGNNRASTVIAVSAIISALIGAGWTRFEKASSDANEQN